MERGGPRYRSLKSDETYQNLEIDRQSDKTEEKQKLYDDSVGDKQKHFSCTKLQALCVTAVIFVLLLVIALIAAFARPVSCCKNEAHLTVTKVSPTEEQLENDKCPWQDIRLPSFIVPKHYSLFLQPNLTTFLNKGSVNISFVLDQKSDFVVLHAKDLNFTKFILMTEEKKEITILQHIECHKHEQIYIQFSKSLQKGTNYVLIIDFMNILEEKLEGFYISSYKTKAGEKRYLAATHFEPTAARLAFPCFDEPAMKAKFQLKMVHDLAHSAYFNSKLIKTTSYGNNLMLTLFEETVKMSTYLVAFVVCDFKQINMTKKGIEVRVLAPEEQIDQASFALDAAANILINYEKFFNISYPLSKLDMIAIPDFGAGAMENWGLITYRTTMILFNPEETSTSSEERVATVIAHELAHQWFGNLVTMDWWNDLWLNEGFASFTEYLGTDSIRPEWNMMDQFVITVQKALDLDSLRSSHPIMVDVNDPIEIEAIFDAISYQKGASIIYMLEKFLGMKILQKGLSHYLNKYRFRNARTKDLWDSFTEVTGEMSNINVSIIMDTWTRQMGFPLVMVSRSKNKITVSQARFYSSPAESDETNQQDLSPYGYIWYIPLTYLTDQSFETKHVWLNTTTSSFQLSGNYNWLKLNVNQTGFYRVMYDNEMWKSLIRILQTNHMVFYPADRSNLLDDALTLARVGTLKSDLALNLTLYLLKEQDYVPWNTALLHFGNLNALLFESSGHLLFQNYIQKLLKPVVKTINWENEEQHLRKKLSSLILYVAAEYGDSEIIEEAKKRFYNWMKNDVRVNPDLRNVVYMVGVKFGTQEEWNFCWKKFQESQIPSEQRLLLNALASSNDIWQLSQYLNYSLNKDMIRPQDTIYVLSRISHNPVGRLLTWRFVRENWSKILDMFGQGSFAMDSIISNVISDFSTRFDYNEIKAFFDNANVGSGGQALSQSLERIRANIYWRENVESSVIQWLQQQINQNMQN
ncbi:endoplasmic reticulum aminopeptidase 1-like [Centruroides vittatus]|uniref:endoplasmic reticulum aminopeptidase 1-like n=1 Tax=Centruroides vittatus TaxID=120091 RepID=UPI00350ECEA4